MPCDFIQLGFGNIRDEKLETIWRRMHKTKFFNRINKCCLPAEDNDFIYEILKPMANQSKPVSIQSYNNIHNLYGLPANYNVDPDMLEKNKHLSDLMNYSLSELFGNNKFENMLEIGSGCGFYLPLLRNHADNITVTDLNPHMLELSKSIALKKKLTNMNFSVADATSMPFDDNSFDAIIGHDILHHIESRSESIYEIYRVLKPGGFYFGIEPNVFNPLIALLQAKDRDEWGAFGANKFWIKKTFSNKFKSVEIGCNNAIQTGANKFTLPTVKLADKVCNLPLIRNLSFNFSIVAKK
jgi:SAM-dependent methyltransferase